MIPRILHLWWHEHPAPDWVHETRRAWQDLHPHWAVVLWIDGPSGAQQAAASNEHCVRPDDRIRHHANVARWHLLRSFGGVWVDCDTEPLEPLDPLLRAGTPFCGSVACAEPTVIGGPPNHPLWHTLAIEATRAAPHTSAPHTSAPHLSGAYLLTDVAAAHPDLRVLEPGTFFDVDSAGKPLPPPRTGHRYTRHRWHTSSRAHRAKIA